jgi:hypothetical protein
MDTTADVAVDTAAEDLNDLMLQVQELDPDGVVATHGQFVLTKTGVLAAGSPTFDQWEAALQWCQRVEKYSPFWVGDLLAFGESRYGETYAQAIDATEMKYGTLANAAYVAKAVTADRRRPGLEFGFHQAVAPLLPQEQTNWLERAEAEDLTVAQLRHEIKAAKLTATGNPVDCWLSVHCANVADLSELSDRMKAEGRSVKPHIKEAKEADA